MKLNFKISAVGIFSIVLWILVIIGALSLAKNWNDNPNLVFGSSLLSLVILLYILRFVLLLKYKKVYLQFSTFSKISYIYMIIIGDPLFILIYLILLKTKNLEYQDIKWPKEVAHVK